MRPLRHRISIVAAAYLAAQSGCAPERSPAATPPRAIPVAEIRDRGVVGLLGRPLGTAVTVTGVAVPNASRRKADAGEALFLRITAVDGRPLAEPVDFAFHKAHEVVDVAEPVVGRAFTYRGFETGGFAGVPLDYAAPWQATGFHFTGEFLVLPEK